MTAGPSEALHHVCDRALDHNLALRVDETVVLVTDGTRPEIVAAFEAGIRKRTGALRTVRIPVSDVNGQEPPGEAAEAMAAADVVVMPTARSLSWTRARRRATDAGARVASMPHITEEIACRTLTADYEAVRERVNRVADRIDAASEVRVRTEAGTDLTFRIDGRAAHGRKGGLYRRPGEWGNLPCGEAFVAPVEGTANGVYVVDASHAGVGKVEQPIRITVREGRAVRIEGGAQARRLDALLLGVGHPDARGLAEFGVGCNPAARIVGVTLEDEKALGTCHFALGRNNLFGGTLDPDVHLDGVLRAPTIELDGRLLAPAALAG